MRSVWQEDASRSVHAEWTTNRMKNGRYVKISCLSPPPRMPFKAIDCIAQLEIARCCPVCSLTVQHEVLAFERIPTCMYCKNFRAVVSIRGAREQKMHRATPNCQYRKLEIRKQDIFMIGGGWPQRRWYAMIYIFRLVLHSVRGGGGEGGTGVTVFTL